MQSKARAALFSSVLVLLAIVVGAVGVAIAISDSLVFGIMIAIGALPLWGLSCYATAFFES